MKRVFGLGIAIVMTISLVAQTFRAPSVDPIAIPPDRGAAGMSRWLRELQTRASLLMVTAHPDDEDGGMLTFETRGQGVRAGLLTLNRGEGGQNVMSGDLYDALGLTRTEELLAADRYLGVEQYFTGAVDYGFSKTREEALEKWGHERVLSDAVRVVRTVRPLVITSVFAGAATDGHGNHQVAGELAQEAYVAAGDPKRFPEQIQEGLRPWSPLKVYARVPNFRVTDKGMYDYAIDKYVPVRFFDYVNQKWTETKPTTTLEVHEGQAAPAVGLTFVQIAREGLGLQKTQNGGGLIPAPAPQNTAYHRYGSRVAAADHEESFFDGIDISVGGIATLAQGDTEFVKQGLAVIARDAADALHRYAAENPAAIAPLLADGLKATRELLAQVRGGNLAEPGRNDVAFELEVKERQFQRALAAALQVSLQASAAGFTIAIPGQSFDAEARIFNENAEALKVDRVEVFAQDGKNWEIRAKDPKEGPAHEVAAGKQGKWQFAVTVPGDAALTRPYFSRPNDEQAYYDLVDARYRNLPFAPYPLAMRAVLTYRGVPFTLEQTIETSERIPGIGTVSNPLIVGPAISVTVSPSAGAVPLGSTSFAFTATVHSNVKGPAAGVLRLKLPEGWRSTPAEAPFAFARDGEDQTVVFSVAPDEVKAAEYKITAVAEYKSKTYEEGYHLAGYPGIRPYPLYRPAVYRAEGVDVKTAPGLRIGFLPGTGDDVPKALQDLNEDIRVLADSDLTQGNLSTYDAIILGVRAYAVRSDLRAANARLLEYVKNGGVLIVQYNLQGFDSGYGPYPLTLGSNPQKVVDEGSSVRLTDPSNPAFSWPNRITEADFKGWVEERGHGFISKWDSHYQPLIETHDPDQDSQEGGLLLARYGKGFYVYDALALYRQLPSGVAGAYRILANLVSLSRNPAWK